MEVEEIKAQDLRAAPPVLPWRDFANWIGMGEEHETVRGWIRKGYIPAYKIGKHVMVNVALFVHICDAHSIGINHYLDYVHDIVQGLLFVHSLWT